jgi:hypothetical protein
MTIHWPEDTRETIERLRSGHYTWREIADHFGCNVNTIVEKYRTLVLGVPEKAKGEKRRFTPEEDAEIRRAYQNFEDLTVTAAKMGRRRGDIYQRILRVHPDLLNKIRKTTTQVLINQYGIDTVKNFDANLHEAATKLRAAKVQAKAEARVAAIEAKAKHYALNFTLADQAIANGEDRNEVIFQLRAQGISLEKIGSHFKVSRERIRQIFDAVSLKKSLVRQLNESRTVQGVGQAAAAPNGRTDDGPESTYLNSWGDFNY